MSRVDHGPWVRVAAGAVVEEQNELLRVGSRWFQGRWIELEAGSLTHTIATSLSCSSPSGSAVAARDLISSKVGRVAR